MIPLAGRRARRAAIVLAVAGAGGGVSLPATATLIHGYATSAAVVQGDTLELHVSTAAPRYDVLIEDALDPTRILAHYRDLPGAAFAVPESAYAWGCGWPVTLAVPVDPQWPSGVYYARLVAAARAPLAVADTSFVTFVVREDEPGSTSPILFQLSTTTYNAYNAFGGKSLYPQNSQGFRRSYFVSTQRPYDEVRGKGQFTYWERPLAAWFRSEGIPVEFCTNLELHREPDLLAPYRLFLSVGHDEYYSKEMFDRLEDFRASGGNLAFFGANNIFWQVRFEGETMVCYKDYTLDPYYALGLWDRVTVNFRSPPVNRPEGFLIGIQYDSWCWRPCGVPIQVVEPNHWTMRHLGLYFLRRLGESVVGYEWDRRFVNAQPEGLETMFLSSIHNHSGSPRFQQSSFYEYPAADPVSRIFAAGTIQWSWGVRPDSAGADSALVAITRRIVRCLGQPPTLEADREVIFVADLRHMELTPEVPVWLRGRPAPLLPDGTNLRMLDDGVPPDSVAGDRIYTRAVLFPAGSWDIVRFSYWTVGECGFFLRSAWIEDPDLGPGSPVVLRDRPDFCPVPTAAEGAETPPAADLALRVMHTEAGVQIAVTAPPGLAPGGGASLRVALYDVAGRLVQKLAEGPLSGGRAEFLWTGRDEHGRQRPSGVYLVVARLGGCTRTAKIAWSPR